MQRRYKAFISYSWADKAWGNWLHRTLELYRTPKALIGAATPLGPAPARLHPIFKDREEEAAGHGIGAAIETAMDASDFLIVVCSPRSAKSKWVNREVAWFKTRKSKERVLALVVDGEPGVSLSPGKPGEECFPATLLYKVDENLQPTEALEDVPLAADARKEGDGKRLAKLKLAAALLGLGLDDLVKRDDRRRAVRRRWAMGGMGTIAASMTALALVAVEQRNQARKMQAEAEFQRDEAEGLVEFMITDMRKKLDAVGRLELLDSTAQRTLDFYERQNPEGMTPDSLGRRARALLLFGEVHNSRGDLDAALAAYRQAAATTGEQLRRDPDNEQRIFDHSQSVFWVGYIAWQRGDAETARAYWSQYHDQAERLVDLDPDNDDWQTELMYAHSNLGTLAMDQGDANTAEAHFVKALDLNKKFVGETPTTPEAAIDLGQSYSWLAEALYHQGRMQEAKEIRENELAAYDAFEVCGGRTCACRKQPLDRTLRYGGCLDCFRRSEESDRKRERSGRTREIALQKRYGKSDARRQGGARLFGFRRSVRPRSTNGARSTRARRGPAVRRKAAVRGNREPKSQR